jgi:hypothetical protein
MVEGVLGTIAFAVVLVIGPAALLTSYIRGLLRGELPINSIRREERPVLLWISGTMSVVLFGTMLAVGLTAAFLAALD